MTRWFSDASALTRYGVPTVNYGTSTGLMDVELGENLEIDGLVKTAEVYATRRDGDLRSRMKLVTFNGGKVGRVDGDEIVELDVRSMREYFEAGGAHESGRRTPLADAKLEAPIVPKKFFHTAGNFREHEDESKNVNWSHRIAPWINFFQNVDAIIGPDEPIVYPEHLTEELDYELELAVVLKKAGKWFCAGGGGGLHRRLRHLQRHHRARHPARRDALAACSASARRSTRSARSGRGS